MSVFAFSDCQIIPDWFRLMLAQVKNKYCKIAGEIQLWLHFGNDKYYV